MDNAEFDRAVVKAVFEQAAVRGWADTSLVEAAQDAQLDLTRVRARFPGRGAVLMRFGVQADQAALGGASTNGAPREKLFDMLMNRFEALQAHRGGMMALLQALRVDPATAVLLYGATLRSMKWLLEAAGVPASGLMGQLRVHGLMAVWLYALRAWERDESEDLSATMAAVDRGLDRAMQAERGVPGRRAMQDGPAPEPPAPEGGEGELPGSAPQVM
ncbi:MAG: TetR family transcriptional regulator [Acetobacteraceae bacterium]|nr:TetR family transcriptional regulator [Acetobacteraceae bacterium]